MFDGIVRKNVDYFVKRVIDIFNESCNSVYRIEQFSAWHGPDRLVDEDCQRSYAINMPSKEFIRKVENLIPAVEKFSKQLF